MRRASLTRMLALALVATAAALAAPVAAGEPAGDADWASRPDTPLSGAHPSYWRIAEPWADPDAVVTLEPGAITYSDRCELAALGYAQHPADGEFTAQPANALTSRCGDPSPAFLRFYFELREAEAVKTDGAGLALGSVAAPSLRLVPFDPPGLEHRRWIITAYDAGSGTLATPIARPDLPPPRITFASGVLQGSPGCAGLEGGYTLAGSRLSIDAGWVLAGFCPQDLTDEDDRVVVALRRVRSIQPDGVRMRLEGEHGEVEVVLAPA